jgi:hypothetical protein
LVYGINAVTTRLLRLNIAKKNLMRTSGAIKTKKVSHKEIVKGMRALRRRVKPGKLSVREMIKEGRRF